MNDGSRQEKQLEPSALGRAVCAGGPNSVTSNSGSLWEGTVDTSQQASQFVPVQQEDSTISTQSSRKRKRSLPKQQSIVVCRHPSKNMIFSAKSTRCRTYIQSTDSIKISRPGSTTKGKVSRGFWSMSKAEKSKQLWLPTETGSRASEWNSLNGLSKKQGLLSSFKTAEWFHPSRNSLKTSWLSSTHSLVGSTVAEGTKALNKAERMERSALYKTLTVPRRAQKKVELDAQLRPRVDRMTMIELLPTPTQHSAFLLWFRDARRMYNLATNHVL